MLRRSVSRSPSPVNARATTLPGPATLAASSLTSDSTGPWRVARTASLTSAAPFTWIVSSRVSNGLGPSGVRYFAGSLGSTVSMNRSWTFESAVVRPQAIESFWPRTKTGRAGNHPALDRPFGRDDAGQIPEDRRAEIEMRIVGEDRLSGLRPRSGDHPFVRRAAADSGQARRSRRRCFRRPRVRPRAREAS